MKANGHISLRYTNRHMSERLTGLPYNSILMISGTIKTYKFILNSLYYYDNNQDRNIYSTYQKHLLTVLFLRLIPAECLQAPYQAGAHSLLPVRLLLQGYCSL